MSFFRFAQLLAPLLWFTVVALFAPTAAAAPAPQAAGSWTYRNPADNGAGSHDNTVEVLKRIPLRVPKGRTDPVTGTRFLTGLPPAALTAERLVDTAGHVLPNDPYGLDSEGVVVAHDGSFWVSSEYGSSLLHFSRRGVRTTRAWRG